MTYPLCRREFLRAGLALAIIPPPGDSHSWHAAQSATQDSLPGGGARGRLRDPSAVGSPRSPTAPEENDAEIQAIERRLACNCGCTLDVFTCRTTDFSCTYSPALHREVLALHEEGKTAQQILDAFVAKYGEKALMAPEPQGFNLAGYLLPGAVIAAAAAGLILFVGRRKTEVALSDRKTIPPPPAGDGSPEEMERLRRALAELED
jgi:cytochrome c-type biogenesis protein CcmH